MIKNNGGIFGRNPTFNNVEVEGDLTVDGSIIGTVAAGGSNTQIQFNNAGVLDANAGLTYESTTVGYEQLKVGSQAVRFLTISGRVGTGSNASAIQPNNALDIESISGSAITIGDASGSYDGTTIVVDSIDITLNASTVKINCPVSSSGYTLSSSGIQTKIASYSLTPADNGKVIIMNVAIANSLTVPASLGLGFSCTVIQIGAGQTTVNTSAGVTLRSYQSHFKISGQHGSARIVGYFTDLYNLSGNLSA